MTARSRRNPKPSYYYYVFLKSAGAEGASLGYFYNNSDAVREKCIIYVTDNTKLAGDVDEIDYALGY